MVYLINKFFDDGIKVPEVDDETRIIQPVMIVQRPNDRDMYPIVMPMHSFTAVPIWHER
jgi:hypothetical protein